MTFSKHNWNQLSESSQRELKLREAYKEGYRQGLLELGPAAYRSNEKGQQFDRWGNPIGPPIVDDEDLGLAAGDELGMLMPPRDFPKREKTPTPTWRPPKNKVARWY